MERGSSEHGAFADDHLKEDTRPLEQSSRDARAEEGFTSEAPSEEEMEEIRAAEGDDTEGVGERIAGTGSSAERFPLQDQGEAGGASHPKPKDESDRGEGVDPEQ